MKRILFLCTHNTGRSQIAEAVVNRYYGGDFEARSAGTEVGGEDPAVKDALESLGFDTSEMASKHLDVFLHDPWDYVVTLCDPANETCPFFPGGGVRVHHSFPDPAGFSGSSDERRARVVDLIEDIRRWFEEEFVGR